MHRGGGALHLNMVRPFALGTLLGVANTIALTQLYALVAPDPQYAGFVLAYGTAPALLLGAIFGMIAGALRDRRPWTRMWLLCTLSFLGVVAVGVTMDRGCFIRPALLPTLACTLLLERWTRSEHPEPAPAAELDPLVGPTPYERKRASYLAMFLGAVTLLVTMSAAVVASKHRPSEILHAVFDVYPPFGLLVGMLLGMPFGALATATRTEPAWVRRLVLMVLASQIVFVLGTLCQCTPLILPSMIPTLAACLLLESRTRAEPAVPPVRVIS